MNLFKCIELSVHYSGGLRACHIGHSVNNLDYLGTDYLEPGKEKGLRESASDVSGSTGRGGYQAWLLSQTGVRGLSPGGSGLSVGRTGQRLLWGI